MVLGHKLIPDTHFGLFVQNDSVMLCGLLKSYIKLLAAVFKRSFSAV